MVKRKPKRATTSAPALLPEQIDRSILVVRGRKVLLDEQLAGFYGVPTKGPGSSGQTERRAVSRGFYIPAQGRRVGRLEVTTGGLKLEVTICDLKFRVPRWSALRPLRLY
jgi:hypothetical protein